MCASRCRIDPLQERSLSGSFVRFLFFALCMAQFADAHALGAVRVMETRRFTEG